MLVAGVLLAGGALGAPAGPAWRVVDGDTLDRGGVRYRLKGVDAFELDQTCVSRLPDGSASRWACGEDAKRFLARIVAETRAYFTCAGDPDDLDAYGRHLVTCYVAGPDIWVDVAHVLMSLCYAMPHPRYGGEYRTAWKAIAAVREPVGYCKDSFTWVYPWEWRRSRN